MSLLGSSKRSKVPLNFTAEFVYREYQIVLTFFCSSGLSHDSRLRCAVVDLYFVLYGKNRPSCLPTTDGSRSSVSNSVTNFTSTALFPSKIRLEGIESQ